MQVIRPLRRSAMLLAAALALFVPLKVGATRRKTASGYAPNSITISGKVRQKGRPKTRHGHAPSLRQLRLENRTRRHIASALLRVRGTANLRDAVLVRKELIKLPLGVLKGLLDHRTKVVVCRYSICEVRPRLKGVRPRGWPEGQTWDTVPGLHALFDNEVIIATRKGGRKRVVLERGNGHGCNNLVIHETLHAYNHRVTNLSASSAFLKVRELDWGSLPAYEKQSGSAGPSETFAERGGTYFGKSGALAPNLRRYFREMETRNRTITNPVVNINTATAERLQLLSEIGPQQAKAIISYRKHRKFNSISELAMVAKIGEATEEAIRRFCTIKGPSTLVSKPH